MKYITTSLNANDVTRLLCLSVFLCFKDSKNAWVAIARMFVHMDVCLKLAKGLSDAIQAA